MEVLDRQSWDHVLAWLNHPQSSQHIQQLCLQNPQLLFVATSALDPLVFRPAV
jgi:hypothetical protein